MNEFRSVHATGFGHVRLRADLRDVEVRLGTTVVTMPLHRYRDLRDLIYQAAAANSGTPVTLRSSSGLFEMMLSAADVREAVALLQVADVVLRNDGVLDDDE